ncbi:MAG: MBL fold metallo-hydrolase [Rhizobiaceae bacterium]|nr:MBL fold metallo-hydrolase [Hyphomicrobiales bacterium]NRB30029.1 MBL fold metallo-hydrolase [Rhizobiaceae bacterium]
MTDWPIHLEQKPIVKGFFDPATNTISYCVQDPESKTCALYDSVLDFDFASGRTSKKSADELIAYVKEQGLTVEWIIETHVHADHLSAAPYLQEQLGGKLGIGARVIEVQDIFGKIFNEGTEFQRDGSQFDALFEEGDTYKIGGLDAFVMATPGHTPACMCHVIGDSIIVGDTLFMPDGGSARADFPGGDARELYQSIRKVLSLPQSMRMFICHDYGPGGREIAWETTVGQQRAENIHVKDGVDEEAYVKMRTERDAQLAMPKLIIPSVQVNMRAGDLPEPDSDGKRYLKVPVDEL